MLPKLCHICRKNDQLGFLNRFLIAIGLVAIDGSQLIMIWLRQRLVTAASKNSLELVP